ncbi:MAG: sensor histidine kinase, partial [Acidimicrobiales bacterium]
MRQHRTHLLHAAKVATAATVIVTAIAIFLAVALNLVLAHRLVQGVDNRLSERLSDVVRPDGSPTLGAGGFGTGPTLPRDGDISDAPTFIWRVGRTGVVTPLTIDAPTLPRHRWDATPVTLTAARSSFRFDSVRSGSGWLVAGESVGQTDRVSGELLIAEILLGTLLLVVTFVGSLVVGLRASAPIEQIRRRQSEFTADASHELRTPLSVIEAEVELALSRPRQASDYRETLSRVSAESARLRSIVDDLLWLARADGELSGSDADEPVDIAAVAESTVDRFAVIARAGNIALSFRHYGNGESSVRSPPDSVERLIAVLVDNACRYGGTGGVVDVSVRHSDNRVTLTVADSGPGIPEEHLEFDFDRFHRATELAGGTGLGLAIADAVVRNTHGMWSIGRGPLGGAEMSVSWRQVTTHPSEGKNHSGNERHDDRPGVVSSSGPGSSPLQGTAAGRAAKQLFGADS